MALEKIFGKLQHVTVKTEFYKIELYRLGMFEGAMYEFVLLKGGKYREHAHANSDARLHVVDGRGYIILNGQKRNYKKGDSFFVPKGTRHGFDVKKETLMLSIQKPPIINQESGRIDIRY